jgi:hypothetical protein
MVVHDLNLIGVIIPPKEANPELVVDPDAVLTRSVPLQGFQAIARRTPQVFQIRGGIQD